MSKDEFHALRVAEVVRETEDANSIRFHLPDDKKPLFAFKAGQHLTLKADIDGEEVRRNYSLCVAPHEGVWKVTVKRIAGGVMSNWVGDHLNAGDMIDVLPPHARWPRRGCVLATIREPLTFGPSDDPAGATRRIEAALK